MREPLERNRNELLESQDVEHAKENGGRVISSRDSTFIRTRKNGSLRYFLIIMLMGINLEEERN
jgi:hypothetical protein